MLWCTHPGTVQSSSFKFCSSSVYICSWSEQSLWTLSGHFRAVSNRPLCECMCGRLQEQGSFCAVEERGSGTSSSLLHCEKGQRSNVRAFWEFRAACRQIGFQVGGGSGQAWGIVLHVCFCVYMGLVFVLVGTALLKTSCAGFRAFGTFSLCLQLCVSSTTLQLYGLSLGRALFHKCLRSISGDSTVIFCKWWLMT